MTTMNHELTVFRLKDPISSLSHFAGFVFSIPAGLFLLVKASASGCSLPTMIGLAVFCASLSLLYAASAAYHAFYFGTGMDGFLRRVDHCSIFVLIAGSYTPICLSLLNQPSGTVLLSVVWGIAIAGIAFKILWIDCPKVLSSIMYIGMGWACLSVLPQLLPSPGFVLLLSGGIFYTIGGVIYSLKPNLFPNEAQTGFGNHELFHFFVLAGSLCHWWYMLEVITAIG